MQKNIRKMLLLAGMVTAVLLTADVTCAQLPEARAERLRSPAVVRGVIGGESHDSYVIRAAKGKTMTVRLSWRDEDGNQAQFTVNEGAEPVTFGKESDDGKRWTGKIPRTANYYIYVVAHPIARYTLRVTLK
jgi:hypothetical protein